MKILVAGAGGQLGREVVEASREKGLDVASFAREGLDISDFQRVSDTVLDVRPDVIINCAAFNDVDGAESRWQDAFSVNGVGVKNLALAARRVGAVVVHFSTDYVFDGNAEKPYTIADRPNPINSYGQSKLLGEELLEEHGDRFYLIRTSWVFGKGKNSFPLKLLEWASRNPKLRIVDDQVSNPTYAADLASAVLKLIETGRYGVYHITNSGYTSKYEWAVMILDEAGWEGSVEPAKSEEFKTPARRPGFSALDNFPLSEVIGGLLPSWDDATKRFLREVL